MKKPCSIRIKFECYNFTGGEMKISVDVDA